MMRWWRVADRKRAERFSFFPLFAAGFWGLVFLFVWPWSHASSAYGVIALMMAALVVQAVSPWSPPPPPMPKRLRLKA
jgi:hypothetical protein